MKTNDVLPIVNATPEPHPALHHESSPAYNCLRDAGLLANCFRKRSAAALDLQPANSTITRNTVARLLPGFRTWRIDDGMVGLMTDGRGGFRFLAPGLHCYLDPFLQLKGRKKLTDKKIVHGDLAIVTVPQGFIGVASQEGQPLLLPPGLHQWRSPTVELHKVVDLTAAVIHIDPYTLVTVDEGYAAVTQDNGKMKILDGGAIYMLQHRNHKFEMFISQKIQTDELRGIKCASADNVVIAVQATVNWRIVDVETAARMAADTMLHGGGNKKHRQRLQKGSDDVHVNNEGALDLGKLRNDVLKQAEASLSAFIALVNYSDTFGVAHGVTQREARRPSSVPVPAAVIVDEDDDAEEGKEQEEYHSIPPPKTAALFDLAKLQSMVGHANEVTQIYGVEILSINIIQAFPDDNLLMERLAKGAVAAAEAQQAETSARGNAVAKRIAALAEADAITTLAQANAEADKIRAAGARAAAETLATSGVAVDLARIDHMGAALQGKNTLFFGDAPQDVIKKLVTKKEVAAMA